MISTLFGIIMAAGFVACYIPQVVKIYKTKTTDDISVGQYYLTIVGYVGALLYMFSLGMIGFWLILNYLSGIAFCVWIILLCKKYQTNPTPNFLDNTVSLVYSKIKQVYQTVLARFKK